MTGKESGVKTVRYGQINLHKSKAATAELNRRVEYDIVFIMEPYDLYGLVRIDTYKGCTISCKALGRGLLSPLSSLLWPCLSFRVSSHCQQSWP